MAALNEAVAYKLCIDAHFMGKHIMSLYRSLFTFTHALIILTGDRVKVGPKDFNDYFTFCDNCVKPNCN